MLRSMSLILYISNIQISSLSSGVNGIEFGNEGELYIQVGSNTNGGIPGPLTTKQIQKENYYSAATVVAYLADPQFNGFITYDANDNGTPNGGHGVKIFAAGTRNPFGIVMHSNGNLYGTENGSNLPYGTLAISLSQNCVPVWYLKKLRFLLVTSFNIHRKHDDRL
jgi:hypothetical protein